MKCDRAGLRAEKLKRAQRVLRRARGQKSRGLRSPRAGIYYSKTIDDVEDISKVPEAVSRAAVVRIEDPRAAAQYSISILISSTLSILGKSCESKTPRIGSITMFED
jgi:hypothetical protein